MKVRAPRPVGCRRCGSRDHTSKTHDGALKREHALVEISTRRDPLGIASSSWLVAHRVPRPEAA